MLQAFRYRLPTSDISNKCSRAYEVFESQKRNCCCKCQQCCRDNNKYDLQTSTASRSVNKQTMRALQEHANTTLSLQKSMRKQNEFNGLLTTRNIFWLSPWPTSWPLSKFMPKIPATALISPSAKVPVANTSPIYSKSLSQSAFLARCNQSKKC